MCTVTMFKFKMFTRTFKKMFKCVDLLCHNANTSNRFRLNIGQI